MAASSYLTLDAPRGVNGGRVEPVGYVEVCASCSVQLSFYGRVLEVLGFADVHTWLA